MLPRARRPLRRWSLTRRLVLSMSFGAALLAVVLGFLGADRDERRDAARSAAVERDFAATFAERCAPLLERGDFARLAQFATAAHDLLQARVCVLDRTGRVVVDVAPGPGGRPTPMGAGPGVVQRPLVCGEGGEDPVVLRETAAPVRFGGEPIGEVRLQVLPVSQIAAFDWSWFGLLLLSGLSLVVAAATMGHHWSVRLRSATDALLRLSAGEVGGMRPEAPETELQDLGFALREMERGLQDGLQRVADGYLAMAFCVVDGLERHKLVVPGHGERTARLAAHLAERLRLVPADRRDLELACRLVDLGKAWVRPAILQKQGPLTDVEAQSLRQHPVRGAEQLECMPGLRRVAAIVRHQAERYDGQGGPHGLRGDRIPLGARILAIAATWDRLLHGAADPAQAAADALGMLQRLRGEAFDPWLVDLFVASLPRSESRGAADRAVMIVPGGGKASSGAEPVDDEDDGFSDGELEVLADEPNDDDRR